MRELVHDARFRELNGNRVSLKPVNFLLIYSQLLLQCVHCHIAPLYYPAAGTPEERGLLVWSSQRVNDTSSSKAARVITPNSSSTGNGAEGLESDSPSADSCAEDSGVGVVPPSTYDLPFCMPLIRRWTWTRFVPLCPTFTGFGYMRCASCTDSNRYM